MKPEPQRAVRLRDLLGQQSRADLTRLLVVSDAVAVRGVSLVTDIEEIASVGPDMIIVLSADISRGSWIVSAALRYAWERHAAALIIPDRSVNPSMLQLAERFEISLFTTSADPTDVAIEVATQYGFAQAQLVSSLHQLTHFIDRSEDISEVLGLASQWLGGAEVSLESSGATIRQSAPDPAARPSGRGGIPSRLSVGVGAGATHAGLLVVELDSERQDRARAVLDICATKLRALLAEAHLLALQRSLAPISIAALGSGESRLPRNPTDARLPDLQAFERWSVDHEFVAVCMLSHHGDKYGPALHQLWLAEFDDCPLIRGAEGWLAFMPLADEDSEEQMVARLQARVSEIHLLDLRVGISRAQEGSDGLRDGIREAWFAARVAEGGSSNAIVSYAELPTALLPHLLPRPFASEILEMMYPNLAAEPLLDELLELYCVYVGNLGSALDTAQQLGLHRNTVKQRLKRLEQLQVPIRDPKHTQGLLLLFYALRRDER